MFDAIIFDMDGVLIDARDWHYEALNEALVIFGVEISRQDHENIFDGLPTKVKLNALSEQGLLPYAIHDLVNALKQDITLRIAHRNCYPIATHLIMVAELKRRGFKLGVATNSVRETTEVMLGLSGLLDLMDTVVTNEDVVNAKPSPDVYQKACNNLGVKASRALVIEDNEYGVKSAKSAGCEVLKISSPRDLTVATIDNFLELMVTKVV